MIINEIYHGFRLDEIRPLPELKAEMYRMTYVKNGADLVWLKRDDENKTFAIFFKTLPSDDTGVFHILEHSVLCGSEKYPLREPFVELIKSSLQTFLNAFTFPDKTGYPVCSRNDQDFLNLMDVYLDAVLHPLSITSPLAFRQEGWHYELEDPQGELTLNGVVYNEMKGAYATADRVAYTELNRALFPDNCYGYESGGYPDAVPELTYENYVASHKRFYHPSNSRIFLDGIMDIDAVLERIGSFLEPYDTLDVDADIPWQAPVSPAETLIEYSIGPEEDGTNKYWLMDGWVIGRFDDYRQNAAAAILASVLCDGNDSPIKKAVLDAGLAADVELTVDTGIQQPLMYIAARDTSAEKKDKLRETVMTVIREQAEQGLDKEQLQALINRAEFAAREKDFGSMPRGLVYAVNSMDSWLYGGHPSDSLCIGTMFDELRAGVDTGYFEALIYKLILDNPHHACVTAVPSGDLDERKEKALAESLRAVKAGWTEAECRKVIDEFAELRRHQETPDTPEQLASLPVLPIEAIDRKVLPIPQNVLSVGGRTVLHQPLETEGILYVDLRFDASDLTIPELQTASEMTSLLGEMATEDHTPLQLGSLIRRDLGRFGASVTVTAQAEDTVSCTPMVSVSFSLLKDKLPAAQKLIAEILTKSCFDDTKYVYNLIRQQRIGMEQSFMMSGNRAGLRRTGAAFTAAGAVNEAISGISALRWLQTADRTFENEGEALCAAFAGMAGKVFVRDRLTLAVTGDADEAVFESLISLLPESTEVPGASAVYARLPKAREGFAIPAQIGFAVKTGSLESVGRTYSGSALVAAQYLTYDYLWNTIRVQGGAYGTGLSVQSDGTVAFTSYRDPQPDASLVAYESAGDALRALCDSEESLDRYIISTIAETEPVLSPRVAGSIAVTRFFAGMTEEKRQRIRNEILDTGREDLRTFADALDGLFADCAVCVVGASGQLEACGEQLSGTENLIG